MIKWIKKLLITLSIVLCSSNINAQNFFVVGNGNYSTWNLTNQTCYGCGSFFIMVANNPTPSNGYFYYDIYFWSNSFYTNGYAANTYIKEINVYAVDPKGRDVPVLYVPYTLVPPKSYSFNGSFYIGYVYSVSPIQTIKISWSSASAW